MCFLEIFFMHLNTLQKMSFCDLAPSICFFFSFCVCMACGVLCTNYATFTTRFTFFSIALLSLSQHITQLYEPYKRISNEMSSLIEFNKRVDWMETWDECIRIVDDVDVKMGVWSIIIAYCMILSTYTSFVSMKLNQRLDWWTKFTLKEIKSKIMWLVGCFFMFYSFK